MQRWIEFLAIHLSNCSGSLFQKTVTLCVNYVSYIRRSGNNSFKGIVDGQKSSVEKTLFPVFGHSCLSFWPLAAHRISRLSLP